MTATRMVADDLIADEPDGPRLIGSRCRTCAAVTFPRQGSCPRCTGEDVEPHLLAGNGTLWGFTIQGFPPKEPYLNAGEPFERYGVGYVDLGGEVLVESRLLADDPAALHVGMPMELVVVPFHQGSSGQVLTYAFAPAVSENEESRS